jgi:nitroreductase
MDTLDAIFTRRSIRKFKADGVPPEMVETLLRAGMQAPSANNLQPWYLVVITRREVLDRIPSFHPYSAMLTQAPLAILVCGDRTLQPMEGYWVQDCSAATQNILLAAHALGLGAVWLGIHPREERIRGMRALLHLPDEKAPLSLIALGWPAEPKGRADRFKPEKAARCD